MKPETLYKRLAIKTDTPILEEILLGNRPISDLPEECMIWKGAVREIPNGRMRRMGIGIYPTGQEMPYGYIKVQNKQIPVHRLIFQLLYKPNFEFRMYNRCGVERCVNPLHWEVRGEEIEEVLPDFEYDATLTLQDVEDMVEIVLFENEPKNWGELINYPILEGIDKNQIREVLEKLNREHLL